jgi:hypothetical protein
MNSTPAAIPVRYVAFYNPHLVKTKKLMKYILILSSLLPVWVMAQTQTNCFTKYMNKNWQIINAINILDSNEIVYNPAKKIKTWDLGGKTIYRLNKTQLGLMDGVGNVDLGIVDSISPDRFIINVTSSNGYKTVYEYKNIKLLKDTLTYDFYKWNFTTNTTERHLHYGYSAICIPSKKVIPKPTLQDLEKKWGNKITFIFTTDDGKPIANKEIKIIIPVNGLNMISYVYTDIKGLATNYFKDNLFSSTNHLTLRIEYGNLKSSAVVEKKYCPITLRRTLKANQGDTDKFDIRTDN